MRASVYTAICSTLFSALLRAGDRGSGILRIKRVRFRERLVLLKRFELLRASGESLGRRTLWRRRTLC